MFDRLDHIDWASEAVRRYQEHSLTPDEHAIADLICDLGHLADHRGIDFVAEIKRAIGHWYAEQHIGPDNILGPDAEVDVVILPK